MGFLQKLFGSHSDHELKRIYPIVDKIEALEPQMQSLSDEELLRRSGQHFSVGKAFMKCSWRFLRFYLIKGGFRDGKAGFTYAALNACYKFTTIAKIWERQFLSEK